MSRLPWSERFLKVKIVGRPTQQLRVLLSDIDLDLLQRAAWHIHDGYVVHRSGRRYADGIRLHRLIAERICGEVPLRVRFRNTARLDLRRENLVISLPAGDYDGPLDAMHPVKLTAKRRRGGGSRPSSPPSPDGGGA